MSYDMSIHHNPSGEAWAKFFAEKFPPGSPVPDEDTMRGWFANAMMAMHDHLASRAPAPVEARTDLAEIERLVQRIAIGADGTCLECGKGYPHKPECPAFALLSAVRRLATPAAAPATEPRLNGLDVANVRGLLMAASQAFEELVTAPAASPPPGEEAPTRDPITGSGWISAPPPADWSASPPPGEEAPTCVHGVAICIECALEAYDPPNVYEEEEPEPETVHGFPIPFRVDPALPPAVEFRLVDPAPSPVPPPADDGGPDA